jgi:integrase
MSRPKSTPSYCIHTPSNRAYITVDGRQIPLGTANTPASREAYDRLIATWLSNGRKLPATLPGNLTGPSISDILTRFWQHAERYYAPTDGKPAKELTSFKYAMSILRHLFGGTAAADFGPKSLKALREAMIRPAEWTDSIPGADGKCKHHVHSAWSRKYANHQISRVKHIFKWATAEELIPPSVYHGLLSVDGLRRGRSEARENEPVRPVADAMVAQVLEFLPTPIAAMVQLEQLCGARGGELCIMRGCDIDTSSPAVWIYRPAQHKTLHHGHDREIPLGPQCQSIIKPFLKPSPQAYLFSPAEWEAERRAAMTAARKTPKHYGNRPGTNKSRKPARPPGDRYDREGFCRAVARACALAFPPPAEFGCGRIQTGPKRTRSETKAEWRERLGPEKWAELAKWEKEHRFHPHQLRHSAATKMRKLFGLEAAGVVLGQRTMAATMIYAEQDRDLAEKVAREIG